MRMSLVVRLIMNRHGNIREMSRWSRGVGQVKSSLVSYDNTIQHLDQTLTAINSHSLMEFGSRDIA